MTKKELNYGGWINPPPSQLIDLIAKLCEIDWVDTTHRKSPDLYVSYMLNDCRLEFSIHPTGVNSLRVHVAERYAFITIVNAESTIRIEYDQRDCHILPFAPLWMRRLRKIWRDKKPTTEESLDSAYKFINAILEKGPNK